jgi:hypothetical protein
MEKYQEIRSEMYRVQLKRWADLINIRSPYTYIKSIYYMETASFFLFITQSFIRSPNFVTFLYALTGVTGALLINLNQIFLFYIGIFMVFTKGTFDWADGPLARRLNKTSFLGHALDCYGAYICDISLRVSFIYYVIKNNSELIGFFPLLAFILMAPDIRQFTDVQYLKKITRINSSEVSKGLMSRNSSFELKLHETSGRDGKLKEWYFRYTAFLDGRARSIDFLLLVLIVDSIYGVNSSVLLLLTFLILLRSFFIYCAGVYFINKVYAE